MAQKGKKTVVIDFDIGRVTSTRSWAGRRVVYDFVNVIEGDATLNQALIKDKRTENLFTLPASQTRDKDALTRKVSRKCSTNSKHRSRIRRLRLPAGIETGALMALYFADEAIMTTNPEVVVRCDTDRILGILVRNLAVPKMVKNRLKNTCC
ncbi:hypothetical protein ACLK1Y_06480 [Escherichia coli]